MNSEQEEDMAPPAQESLHLALELRVIMYKHALREEHQPLHLDQRSRLKEELLSLC